MGRLPRVYIEGILYYVTSKGGHGQTIFISPSEYNEYISLINKYKTQYGFKLFSFVLLPTHLHLLLELRNNVAISNIMHDINSLYTKGFNSRYSRKGHLFQERFKTVLAEKEPYLLQLVRHIHLNPQRTKLIENPRDYPYSSYSQFLDSAKRQCPDMREEIEEVFTMLRGREQAFAEYISHTDQKELNEFRKRLRKKRILGSRDFVEQTKKTIEESIKAQQRKRPLSKRARIMYIAAIAAIIFLASIATSYFYRRSRVLKSEYDKTVELYLSTLQSLKREMNEALKAKKDIENYRWKIRLTEKALEDLKKERVRAVEAQQGIEGYSWSIKLRQIGGPRGTFADSDTIFFADNRVESVNLDQEGFSSSLYSKRKLKNGNLVWEAMQTNSRGETVSWRGEWDGKVMRGILSRRSAKGTVRDFSFVNAGERMKR